MLTIHSNIKSTYLKAIIQVFVFSFLFNNHAVGQYNLVPNPSTENCSNCVDNVFEFIEPNGPNFPGWSNPNILTPDLIKNINQYYILSSMYATLSDDTFNKVVKSKVSNNI